jgi:hypothetical protein
MGSGGIAPRILNVGVRGGKWFASCYGRITLGDRSSEPIKLEVGQVL